MTGNLSFDPKDVETQHRLLAAHMPSGDVWQNKNNIDSNFGKLVRGLAAEYFRLSLLISDWVDEMNINKTSDLILEWEKSVGIPDDCFSNDGPIEERRRNVLLKLTNFGGVQTAEDFVRVAEMLGYTAEVTNGVAHGIFPLKFPIRFFDSRKTAVHTILVNLEEKQEVFPLGFPIQFSSGISGIIECLFRKLAPANCQVLFKYGVI